ncbi:ribosome maturation factor RimM [Kroppenstedtia eburnea]|uniref:Ribosome maturation factor RimM n=1 Tax=Kroppenstedtia eburnea TaxID=714067 RepID=A0A1N7J0V7_9BACL|nr:ribosome maturation factor RimM [Kroppenstedtia eburnea]QKI82391.1 ribosome maturation factor RimM [Kroppenstedtia eburnea]SIS42886.1 16S rRNA processing protein RimM [Kroppenstedtia eburnea]
MQEPDLLTVGRIAGTHGIRGEVRVHSRTDYPELRFAPGTQLLLVHPSLEEGRPITVVRARPHKDFWLVQFEEWTNINQAEPFKGGLLSVSREEAVEPEEDAFYLHEIVGSRVVTTEGEPVGVITEILQPGANDVWVIRKDGGGEVLIPFIDDVVRKVDPSAKQVIIRWMEGLE